MPELPDHENLFKFPFYFSHCLHFPHFYCSVNCPSFLSGSAAFFMLVEIGVEFEMVVHLCKNLFFFLLWTDGYFSDESD